MSRQRLKLRHCPLQQAWACKSSRSSTPPRPLLILHAVLAVAMAGSSIHLGVIGVLLLAPCRAPMKLVRTHSKVVFMLYVATFVLGSIIYPGLSRVGPQHGPRRRCSVGVERLRLKGRCSSVRDRRRRVVCGASILAECSQLLRRPPSTGPHTRVTPSSRSVLVLPSEVEGSVSRDGRAERRPASLRATSTAMASNGEVGATASPQTMCNSR